MVTGEWQEFGPLKLHYSKPTLRYKSFLAEEGLSTCLTPVLCFFFFSPAMVDWFCLLLEEFIHIAKPPCWNQHNWFILILAYYIFLKLHFLCPMAQDTGNLLLRDWVFFILPDHPPYLNQQNTLSSGFHGKELSIQCNPGKAKERKGVNVRAEWEDCYGFLDFFQPKKKVNVI